MDEIITKYDIRGDETLQKYWTPIRQKIWHRIENYGANVNDYGANTLAPHLTRIAQDSHDFLIYLGHPEHVAANFYDAIKISDLGKTHDDFDVHIWKLPSKPTPEQRIEKRLHTLRGIDILKSYLKDTPQELLEHPHITSVIPAHINDHHTPLSQNPLMGEMMEIACLVDAYDGDMDNQKITHGGGQSRTAEEEFERLRAPSPDDKYHGYFRSELVDQYQDFRLKFRP